MRQVSDSTLREIVRSRLTKGDAFLMSSEDYENTQRNVADELQSLSRKQIFDLYPHYTYDLKR